jgi:hypothetical protein
MREISNQIIEAMPIGLVNEFRTKALCLMTDLIEEMEMRFDTLSVEEINFFKVLQSINSDQERFDGMCVAFGKLMYAHQVIDDMYEMAEFQSRVQNQVRSSGDDILWEQE